MEIYNNITRHQATVTRVRREQKNNHTGGLFWFTGLSGAGKSTLAHAVEEMLFQQGFNTYVLDGDNVRQGLCADLSFTDKDRKENIRRITHMANLFVQAGVILLTAFISPFRVHREYARKIAGRDFHEIYCDCSLNVCEQRDVKGLYRRARAGEIPNFTGISSPYEAPDHPELVTNTEANLDASIDEVYKYIQQAVQIKTE